MGSSSYLRDARHVNKFAYVRTRSLFYEPFERHHDPSDEYISLATSLFHETPGHWTVIRDRFWFNAFPKASVPPESMGPEPRMSSWPAQGWKIHVSAVPENAPSILTKVTKVAIRLAMTFKFCLDETTLLLINSKFWPRGISGKFVTLYPLTVSSLRTLLEALYTELQDDIGPYVLSDRRYKDCRVLYYSYGAIEQIFQTDIKGERIPLLIAPDGSALVDDQLPYFTLPPWIEDPFPLPASNEAAPSLSGGRYIVKKALTLSNSGGVYIAQDTTNATEVLIKEARPHTAVDDMGKDAVSILQRQLDILRQLQGTGLVARPLDAFHDWENYFLVQELRSGVTIREFTLTKSPLTRVRPSLNLACDFYEIFTQIFTRFFKAIEVFHTQGITLGDLSANNFKIDPSNYSVYVFDLEAPWRPESDKETQIYSPELSGHASGSKDNIRGLEHDLYNLAANMLYAMFPLAALSFLRNDLYDRILPILLADIGWSETEVSTVINGLRKNSITPANAAHILQKPARILPPVYNDDIDETFLAKVTRELGQFLLSNMRPSGPGCLFPADPFVHRTNSISLGFGACGVLYVLKKCGFEIPAVAFDWLESELRRATADELAPGLLTGAAGIAWAIYELGLRDRARAFIEMANESTLAHTHHSYLYGMAGIGMANLYFYVQTQKSEYLSAALSLADRLVQSALEDERGIHWENDNIVHLGYGYGQTGVALFFLRLSQLSPSHNFLIEGRSALQFDLSHGVEIEDGVISFTRSPSDTSTFEHYIEEGSAGIAKVALRYGFSHTIDMVLADTHRKYVGFAGFLFGLAGFVDVLTDAFLLTKQTRFLQFARRPIAGLRDFYLIRYPHGSATPGENLFRISCDYATGVAGVLRSLHRLDTLTTADFVLDEAVELAAQAQRRPGLPAPVDPVTR